MTVTPELIALTRSTLNAHGDPSAMPDDPGSIAQLTVALRSLLKAVELPLITASEPVPNKLTPRWQSDPENFERIEIRNADGDIIGQGSLFRGAKPSTSAGRYEYDRRREVVAEHGIFHVVRQQNARWPSAFEYRSTREELFREGLPMRGAAQRLQKHFFDHGSLPEPEQVRHLGTYFTITLEIPAEHVREA